MRKGDWIEKYMELVENTEPPLLYHEWTAVMTIAATLKRKVWLRWGINQSIYPNMYVILVGPAGKCRKGTAMIVGQGMLQDLGVKIAPSSVTREALIKILKESTIQEVAKDGSYISHASLTIWSPEWAVFMGGRENMQLIMDLTDWFDSPDLWNYQTKTSGEFDIAGVWVNMFGAITPSTIKSVIPFEAIGGGLTSRIIFVYEQNAEKRVPDPFETPALLALRTKLINELTEIHQLSGQFQMSGSALDFYTEWYLNMEKTNPNMPEMFDGYLSRRQTHLRKLAMILSISESDDMVIKEEHLKRALSLLQRTEVKMPRVFAGIGSSKDSQLMEDLMIYISKHQRVTVGAIFRDFRSFLAGPKHFDDLIHSLVRQGFCRQDITTGDTYIVYNPKNLLHKEYGQNYNRGSSTP